MKTEFYTEINKTLYKGKLSDKQIAVMEVFFKMFKELNITDIRFMASIFGNIYHETDTTFMPIEEYGKGKLKPYGKKIKYSKAIYTTPDKIYYGRGFTQNTWYEIYETLTKEATKQGHNWNFLNNPELLLEVEQSAWATIVAMTKGLYTGKKLSNYFNTATCDFKNARRIINGLDKAELVEQYSIKFYKALQINN